MWRPLVIEEAISAAYSKHALEMRPRLRKIENGVAWLDVAAVALVGGNTSDTIKRGVTTKSVESICSVELSHLARPLSIGILLSYDE